MTETILDICLHTVCSVPTLERADADAVVDTLTERIINILPSDPELSARSTDSLLMLADLASRSVDELGELVEGGAKLDDRHTDRSGARGQSSGKSNSSEFAERLDAEVTP